METRKIGSLEVSVIGLGTNNFGFFMTASAVAPVVDAAIEEGINFFDTADSYLDSERRLGQALGRRRDQVIRPPSSVVRWVRTEPGARPLHTSAVRSSAACTLSAPTGSTSTNSTVRTRSPTSRTRWPCWMS